MSKSHILLIITTIIWTGCTVCVAIAPENTLYIMIAGGFLSLGAIKNAGDF